MRQAIQEMEWEEVTGYVLLYLLVFGMSATVDMGCMMSQIRNVRAILTGVFCQFVILPILGFLTVKSLGLDHSLGITLLVVTSSPGGSYSNWWCSMFNGDLALSVAMTGISTVLSVVMLPLNLLIYAKFSYEDDVISNLDWKALFTSLGVVISAIALGLLASDNLNSHNFNIHANRLGNLAGISLVLFSAYLSTTGNQDESDVSSRGWKFYVGVVMPCALGLLVSNIISTLLRLLKPERVTVSIECCYQNTGIATSVALAMFKGDELSRAMGVPLCYGMVEALVLGIYCIIAWKCGWTKAPANENFFTMLSTSYEVLHAEKAEEAEYKELQEEEEEMSVKFSGATDFVKLSDALEDKNTDDVATAEQGKREGSVIESEAGESKGRKSVGFAGSIIMGPSSILNFGSDYDGSASETPKCHVRKFRGRKEPSFSSVKLPGDALILSRSVASRRRLSVAGDVLDEEPENEGLGLGLGLMQ